MKKNVPILVAILLLATTVLTAQTKWHVKAGHTTGTHTGESWANAFDTLQHALDSASFGDTIWVANGNYYPTKKAGNGTAERNKAFVLKSGVAIYGSFSGNETSLAERVLPTFDYTVGVPQGYASILSGDIGVSNDSTDNCYHVVISACNISGACLDGFSIIGGNGIGATGSIYVNGKSIEDYYGGGIYITDYFPMLANITIRGNTANNGGGIYSYNASSPLNMFGNITIVGNTAANYGGGIYNYISPIIFMNAFISGNSAYNGGGMYNFSSSPELTDVNIRENLAGSRGGGMYNSSSSPSLTNVSIRGNSASTAGGGICNTTTSSPILTNVCVSGNSASYGGGIYDTLNSSPTLTNVTISGNTASLDGGGMYNTINSSPAIYNTIVWGNKTGLFNNSMDSKPTFHNCLIQGIDEDTAGCISAATVDSASLFVAAISHTRASSTSGDYSLKINSPVINMGNNTYNSTNKDLAGNLRIVGTAIDLGAYESLYLTVNFDATSGTPVPDTQYIVYNGKVALPINPTNRGYSFTGWYTQAIGGTEWDFTISKVTQDTTLYAQWTAAYTVAFDATGGTLVPDTQYIVPNGKVVPPTNPTRSGYTFNGWYNQASDGIEWDFATSEVTQDTTLYAQWSTSNIDILDVLYDNNKLQQNSLLDYQVLCAESGDSFTFTILVNSGNILSGNGISGNTLTVNIPKAGIYSFPFSITSQDSSQTENHVLKVERRYAFDEIVKVKWNNTLMVYLNRLSSDGFDVAFYRWYKGNTLLDEKTATYSAGTNATDLLSSTEPYRVEIVLKNGEVIRSCSEVITIVANKSIRLYPNPAIAGQTITVEADLPDEDAVITIYDAQGTPLSTTRLQGTHTQVQLPVVAGSYLLNISGKDKVIYSTTTVVK